MALGEGVRQYPRVPLMKELWAVVKQESGKKTAAADSKALERAVADLWENGE